MSFQTCKCYGAHKAGWAASKILSAEQERETINWYSKRYGSLHPEVALFSLSLFLHHPLPLFFPLPFFTNQTSEFPGNKIGHRVGGWLYFILIMTPRSQGLCRWFQRGDSQCHPSHVGIAAFAQTHAHTNSHSGSPPADLELNLASAARQTVSPPPHPTQFHPERSHNANPASEWKKMTGSRPVTAGWSLWWIKFEIVLLTRVATIPIF